VDAAARKLIELRDITKVYRMGDTVVNALAGVSLDIEDGEFIAIMGSSGSGKSTMMNVLGCLDRPSGGSYRLAGEEVAPLGANALAEIRNRKIGFVFQGFNLLARTSALENVELPLMYAGVSGKERRQRATEALERVGLGTRLHHHPNQLSGGQQQRVAIARALVGQPRIILADEPTGNLDTRTSVEVMAILQELNRAGMTICMVTHEADIAAFAQRVVTMRDGQILSDARQVPAVANPARTQPSAPAAGAGTPPPGAALPKPAPQVRP
jgi:putative ABC transport system ATP-binding protein